MIILRKISFYVGILGLIFAMATVYRLRAREPVQPPPVAPPVKPSAHAIAATGLVEARRENTNIGVPTACLIKKVCVQVWDRVDAGQPLLELDDRELRATLLTQEANIAVSEATLHRVEDLRDRAKKLSATLPGAISAEDLQMKTNDAAVAAAQVAAAKAAVAQTQALIDRLVVRAPIAGTILRVNVRAGEFASPTSTNPPIVLGHIDEVQVRADVDEQLAPRVRIGQKAIGYLKGDTTHPIPLRFVRIEPFVVPKVSLTGASSERVDTRVLEVIYAFKNTPEQSVYVGQQMDIYLQETPSQQEECASAPRVKPVAAERR